NTLRAFGFGSVPVLFETPPGYLLGFRDYVNNLSDAFQGTQVGILAYVGNYGATDEDITLPVTFFRIADDINGNGIQAATTITVIGPDGVARTGILHDFDDLHKFDIFFDNVTVHNRTNTNGVEAMWTHDLSTQDLMAKHQNNQFTVSWGARFLRLYDEFDVNGAGSILGDSFWDTSFTNNIVGPQVGFQWINERQRWRIQTDARFMAGFNIANWNQIGLMGQDLIPGALNSLLYARPTAFSHGLRDTEFAPVGELRVSASYHITNAFALNFGYTGAYVGGIKRAATSVHYSLPDMGYLDTGTQNLLINGFDFGVEFVH
ncbi:MAG TPA: BBP7 family outer membrane beta-barrel protein, partial [Lacipirellulaceae bacterium]|nr:BBP7 family outer membrane beta-barrel protein [Lacipirellulaceae bacterium]